MKKNFFSLLHPFQVRGIVAALVVLVTIVPSFAQASVTVRSDQEVESGLPSFTYKQNTGYVDEVKNRYGVQLLYGDVQDCDAISDKYTVQFGDGESALADCRGVTEHVYKKEGIYTAKYTKNGKVLASVKIPITDNKTSQLGVVLKNISNPGVYAFNNGSIGAERGDRVAVTLARADIRQCTLVNPDKTLSVQGPFYSSETNSQIIEVGLPFDAASQVYKVGLRCGGVRDVVRIDFKSTWEPAKEKKVTPRSAKTANAIAVFDTTLGKFRVELYEDVMPITTKNFIALAKKGFYDNTKFHRVIEGFMIQGGDPITKTDEVVRYGTGGPGYTIKDEFVADPRLTNIRGTIAMANSGPNSGGSQFFINLVDNVNLDYDKQPLSSRHPVFGTVRTGMDVVDKIGSVQTSAADQPLTPVVVKSVRIESVNTAPAPASSKVKVYTNAKYGYSLQYPKAWVVDAERSVVDGTNKLVSIVEVRDKKNTRKVSVIVNQKEMLYKHEALQRVPVIVDGETYTAYLFPNGYECRMANPGRKDCSFFVIPIYRDGVWYELRGIGKAKTVTKEYREIFSSFKFE